MASKVETPKFMLYVRKFLRNPLMGRKQAVSTHRQTSPILTDRFRLLNLSTQRCQM